MTDLDQLLPLWQEVHEAGEEYVLATIVAVEGSGYRKPGARMLIAKNGRRAGTISGGCLEAEVAKKAFWHTENGPVVRRYSTAADDGDVPFGMGCGGVVHVLLERRATAGPLMTQLAMQFAERRPLSVATVLDGDRIGERAYWSSSDVDDGGQPELVSLARRAFETQRPHSSDMMADDGQVVRVWAEYCPARHGLFVFGAGDDAIPLVRMSRQLGWYVAVIDGRSHLATKARFPEAQDVYGMSATEFPTLQLRSLDAAAVMTHSLEQDTRALRHLLPVKLGYLGILGPRRRTEDILRDLATEFGYAGTRFDEVTEAWFQRVHAPMGLDLGGENPRDVALSILAEMQKCRTHGSGMALSQVRGRLVDQAITSEACAILSGS